MRNILKYSWKTLYRILTNYKRVNGDFNVENLADANVIGKST